jgi:hypothetical protein
MKLSNRAAAALSGLALAAGALAAATPVAATASTVPARPHALTAFRPHAHTAIRPNGAGSAVVIRSVNVRKAAAGPQIAARPWRLSPLGRDGKTAGSGLPVRPGGTRGGQAAGPHRSVPPSAPTKINASFRALSQSTSDCGGCEPPDPAAAVSATQIAHTVNLRLEVYSKGGKPQCGVALNTLAGTTARLSDPRIQYDNVHNRFFMVFTRVPGSDTATPTEFWLISKTASACGSWWVYRVTFSGPAFPAGTLLDYPYLGQDNTPTASFPFGGAMLSSSNDFCCSSGKFGTYEGSEAFAIPKYPAYHGQGFSFAAFSVDFATAPVTEAGIPTAQTTSTYWLAAVPGTGYDLFVMTHSSQPSTTMALQASIPDPFSAPAQRIDQPGTTSTLDPLDGRIVWSPMRAHGDIWFAHGVEGGTRPTVQYGKVNVTTNAVTTATASHDSTSEDFNPSVGVFPAGKTTVFVWLNWAYTDAVHNVPTTDTVSGLTPGQAITNLNGTDHKLITGSSTATDTRFGDFSSVAIDPVAASSTCPAGRTAVLAQQYFGSTGQWVTRITRASFC